jgi:UDP-N-acetylglucosamine 2-epimerase
MRKIISIVGARPQFIKVKPVSEELGKKRIRHIIVHTGQHYDHEMSRVFFDELEIPRPDYNLGAGSSRSGRGVERMAAGIGSVIEKERPCVVIVYGDTDSTLAGALAAAKLKTPLAHVEAGLRSYNAMMPEEVNRVITDHIASDLFCPTKRSVDNLAREGISEGVSLVGDTMYDAIIRFAALARKRSAILDRMGLKKKGYLLATIHRQSNADLASNLKKIFAAFKMIDDGIILPLHPRTLKSFKKNGLKAPSNVRIIKPVGYLDMIALEENAKLILTDSGGVQKESYWLKVPCVTMRDETEWVETIDAGCNILTGCDPDRIVRAVGRRRVLYVQKPLYGDGRSAERIASRLIERYLS